MQYSTVDINARFCEGLGGFLNADQKKKMQIFNRFIVLILF